MIPIYSTTVLYDENALPSKVDYASPMIDIKFLALVIWIIIHG